MSEEIKTRNGSIPENLKKLMKQNKMRQSDIAAALGVPKQRITDIISGRRSVYPSDILEICKVLDTTPNKLFGIVHETGEILVTKGKDREVIASISDQDIILKEGYEVTFH